MSKKQKAIKAVAGALAVGIVGLPISIAAINRASTSLEINTIVYASSSLDTQILPFNENERNSEKMVHIIQNSSHIDSDDMNTIISSSQNDFDDQVNHFLSLIQFDREDDDSFDASRFIDYHYENNRDICIDILKAAFKTQSYRYAREVISAIRFSNINYMQEWFKELLSDGEKQPELNEYMLALFELFKEELDAL